MNNTTTKAAETAKKAGTTRNTGVRTMVQIAMLAAVATVLMLWEVPLPFIAPSFYKMDLSEVPIMIGAFAMGPLAAAVIELIKILLNFVLNGTTTAGVGELGNFIMGCALVMPAGFIYKQAKTKKHAIIGMATGIVCMAVDSDMVNGLLLLPAYGKAFGMPVDTFVEMGAAIIPAIHSLTTFCLFSVAPFNIIKGIVVSLITLVLYKHISRLLKGSQA